MMPSVAFTQISEKCGITLEKPSFARGCFPRVAGLRKRARAESPVSLFSICLYLSRYFSALEGTRTI